MYHRSGDSAGPSDSLSRTEPWHSQGSHKIFFLIERYNIIPPRNTMPSSKLDYLKSYYDDSNEGLDATESDRKRKKKHKKRKKRDGDGARSRPDALVLKDEDGATNNDSFAESRARNPFSVDQDEADAVEDEGPTIVKSDELTLSNDTIEKATAPRRRYDSDDDDLHDKITASQQRHRPEDEDALANRSERRVRYDSDEEEGSNNSKKRRRYDSDESEQQAFSKRERDNERRMRYDSDSNGDDDDQNMRGNRKQRYDSSDDDDDEAQRMSSGHKAGLQTGSDFSKEEKKLQIERSEKSQQMVDRYGMGETVHRNISKSEVGTRNAEKRRALNKSEEFALNAGATQMKDMEQARRDFDKIKESAFARSKDDREMNDHQRNAVREGDPMAARGARQNARKPSRPVYKGPAFKPNRFNIRPGFRWDGNDRGNGFEDRLLAKIANDKERREESYRWSSAGM